MTERHEEPEPVEDFDNYKRQSKPKVVHFPEVEPDQTPENPIEAYRQFKQKSERAKSVEIRPISVSKSLYFL